MREVTPEGAKDVWYCEQCGCGYERCCGLGRVIGWVHHTPPQNTNGTER